MTPIDIQVSRSKVKLILYMLGKGVYMLGKGGINVLQTAIFWNIPLTNCLPVCRTWFLFRLMLKPPYCLKRTGTWFFFGLVLRPPHFVKKTGKSPAEQLVNTNSRHKFPFTIYCEMSLQHIFREFKCNVFAGELLVHCCKGLHLKEGWGIIRYWCNSEKYK